MCLKLSEDFELELNGISNEFHSAGSFREQVALLFYLGVVNDKVILGRDFIGVGTAGSVQYDHNNPGQDTLQGWKYIDNMIETENVAGVFHTHPEGFTDFSDQDRTVQEGFAMTYGSRPLWYGVQSLGYPKMTVCCLYMRQGTIFRFNFGEISHSVLNPLIVLPIPLLLDVPHYGMIEVNFSREGFCGSDNSLLSAAGNRWVFSPAEECRPPCTMRKFSDFLEGYMDKKLQ